MLLHQRQRGAEKQAGHTAQGDDDGRTGGAPGASGTRASDRITGEITAFRRLTHASRPGPPRRSPGRVRRRGCPAPQVHPPALRPWQRAPPAGGPSAPVPAAAGRFPRCRRPCGARPRARCAAGCGWRAIRGRSWPARPRARRSRAARPAPAAPGPPRRRGRRVPRWPAVRPGPAPRSAARHTARRRPGRSEPLAQDRRRWPRYAATALPGTS